MVDTPGHDLLQPLYPGWLCDKYLSWKEKHSPGLNELGGILRASCFEQNDLEMFWERAVNLFVSCPIFFFPLKQTFIFDRISEKNYFQMILFWAELHQNFTRTLLVFAGLNNFTFFMDRGQFSFALVFMSCFTAVCERKQQTTTTFAKLHFSEVNPCLSHKYFCLVCSNEKMI